METHPGSPDESSGADPRRPDATAVRGALADLDADSARLAEKVIAPWWYHLALGVLVAAFIAAPAFDGVAHSATIAAAIIAIPLLTSTYKRKHGIWVSGPTGPRSRRTRTLYFGILIPLAIGSVAVLFLDGPFWIPLVLAVVAFAATLTIGRAYDRALRADLLDGEAARR